ncbi:MAG: hypothetical protein EOM91_21860 [Sphingobacteriia bacterium]|nr:hypothetical protein [Sphingobacteriia bacterium]
MKHPVRIQRIVAPLRAMVGALLRFQGEAVRLQPANVALETLLVAPEAVDILEVVFGVVRAG